MVDVEKISISGYEMAMKVMDEGFGVKTDIEKQKEDIIIQFFDHFKALRPDMKSEAYDYFSIIGYEGQVHRTVFVNDFEEYEIAMINLIGGEIN